MVSIATVLFERDLADEFLASLRERRIDEKFFYWFPLSVRAWLALCSDGEYRNYVRSRSLIARSADELAGLLPGDALHVVSLGSGQGDKDLLLLEALRRRGARPRYLPVDASQSLLEMACAAAEAAGFEARGLKADIGRADHLAAATAADPDLPRLLGLIGNTLGAFDPAGVAGALAAILRPQDSLLVDGELYAGAETIAGYDNPLNRRFAWAPLHSIGIGDGDGELEFEPVENPDGGGFHALMKHFTARRGLRVTVSGETLRLEPGERVEMSRSGKYEPGALEGILESAGLGVRWTGTSDDGRFVMALAGVR